MYGVAQLRIDYLVSQYLGGIRLGTWQIALEFGKEDTINTACLIMIRGQFSVENSGAVLASAECAKGSVELSRDDEAMKALQLLVGLLGQKIVGTEIDKEANSIKLRWFFDVFSGMDKEW